MTADQAKAKSERKQERIETLLRDAEDALKSGQPVPAERAASDALRMAFTARAYPLMERAIPILKQARSAKREAALRGPLTVITQRPGADDVPTPQAGCYLFRPPDCVGADGRSLRDVADEKGVPVAVVVHEPRTQLGEWPVVMIGPCTVRGRVAPVEEPDKAWFVEALESLGDAAIEDVEPDLPARVRVERLLDRLETVRDHAGLHDALLEAVREAGARAAEGDER